MDDSHLHPRRTHRADDHPLPERSPKPSGWWRRLKRRAAGNRARSTRPERRSQRRRHPASGSVRHLLHEAVGPTCRHDLPRGRCGDQSDRGRLGSPHAGSVGRSHEFLGNRLFNPIAGGLKNSSNRPGESSARRANGSGSDLPVGQRSTPRRQPASTHRPGRSGIRPRDSDADGNRNVDLCARSAWPEMASRCARRDQPAVESVLGMITANCPPSSRATISASRMVPHRAAATARSISSAVCRPHSGRSPGGIGRTPAA